MNGDVLFKSIFMKQTIIYLIIIVTGITGFYSCFKKDKIDAPIIYTKPVADNNATVVNRYWTKLQILPVNEFFFGENSAWLFDGYNFLIGINDNVFAVSHHGGVWKYEMQINRWEKKGVFPVQMKSVPVVFGVNGKGYCIGDGQCWEYNPVSNQWARKNDPPNDVTDALVISNKVYMLNANNQFIVYDPSSDSYIQKNNFPLTELFGKFVINGAGYYIGKNGECWKFDPFTDIWQQEKSINFPVPLTHTSSFSLNNYGYIIGDLNHMAYNENKPIKVWRYDISHGRWSHITDYPGYGAYQIGAISLNGIVYVGLGVSNGDFNTNDFWRFNE